MVFSLSAKEEAFRKPLFGAKNGANNAFFDLLITKTLQLTTTLNADVVWMDENQQEGQDFASRFTNAFVSLYAQGYDNVISIGNDSPDLTEGHIETALQQLEENKIVLGPSHDGGVYLIGMHKSHFDAAVFKRLSWQQDILFDQLLADATSKNISVFRLNELNDIDSTKDLFTYVNKKPGTQVAIFAKEHLNKRKSAVGRLLIFPITQKCYSSRALRAPPSKMAA